ncbi:hypothetical protein [Brevundimonas sp.]|jgi:hypothetical protein|uniref:hypothetical protein n=1 Tax=Brevundimonas sp. TaxID=1871086 RepID=UPI002E15F37A|nr:hypothetical protein [Brevundimonas sp.]
MAFTLVMGACLVLSWMIGSSKPTIQGFFWGDQKISWRLSLSLILSSSFSLNGLLYQAWLGYLIGWWALLIQLVWCSSFVLLGYFSRKFRGLLDQGTMHGVIGSRFGVGAMKVAAFASVLGFAILIGWEAVVGATVIQNFVGQNATIYLATPLALVLISSLYTGTGGLRGNAIINAAQNIFKIVILCGAAYYIFALPPASGSIFQAAKPVDLLTAIGLLGGVALAANLTFSLFWQIVDMSVWQNLSATPSEKRGVAIWASAVAVFLFPGVIGTVIGVGLSSIGGAVGEVTDTNILNQFVVAIGGEPAIALLLVGAFAASMLSTIDGYALAAAQATTWDLLFPKTVKRLLALGGDRPANADDRKILAVGRGLVLVLAMGGAAAVLGLVMLGNVSLFDLVYAVVVAQMSLVGPVLLCLARPNGGQLKMGFAPIVAALAVGGVMISGRFWGQPEFYTWAPVGTVAASLIVTLALAALPKREPEVLVGD